MRQVSSVIVGLLLLLSAAGVAQQQGRHGSGASHGTATPPAEDSDTATFTRAIADQATDEQVAQFVAMTKSTQAAQQQAKGIERLGATSDHSEELISKASTLQGSVDQALSDTSKFRQSFSKSQQGTFKAPAKNLAKSDAAVSKSGKNLSHQLEEIPPNPGRVVAAIGQLEKALEELQSDQRNLGQAMAIPSH